jgi:hypothetical protein
MKTSILDKSSEYARKPFNSRHDRRRCARCATALGLSKNRVSLDYETKAFLPLTN